MTGDHPVQLLQEMKEKSIASVPLQGASGP